MFPFKGHSLINVMGLLPLASLLAVASLLIGFGIGRFIYRVEQPKEVFAQQIKQSDGSIVIERNPYDKAKKIVMPAGATLLRQQRLVIQPDSIGEIKLDFSLVKMPDKTLRVIAKTDNAKIVTAVDIPVSYMNTATELKWGAGYIYGKDKHGLFLQRFTETFIFGVDVIREKTFLYNSSYDYTLRLGIRF